MYGVYRLCYFYLLGHDIISILQGKVFAYPNSWFYKASLGFTEFTIYPGGIVLLLFIMWNPFLSKPFKEFQILQSFLVVYIMATYAFWDAMGEDFRFRRNGAMELIALLVWNPESIIQVHQSEASGQSYFLYPFPSIVRWHWNEYQTINHFMHKYFNLTKV